MGLSSRPRIFSKVDLPQPEGPMMATNSPSLISNDTPLRAVVSISSVRKILERLDTLIIVLVFTLFFISSVKKNKHWAKSFKLFISNPLCKFRSVKKCKGLYTKCKYGFTPLDYYEKIFNFEF